MQREPELLQIIFALCSASGLASLLHRWQQQRNQDCDDRNDDQKFNERKCSSASCGFRHSKISSRSIAPLRSEI
jgi:hypothetical protein